MKIYKYFLLHNKKLKPWIKYWLYIKSKVIKYLNILPNFAVSTTINTLDFTVNEDKSITVNGTSTGTANFTLAGSSGVATEILKLNANQDYYNTTDIRLVYRLVDGNYGAINSGAFKPTNDLSIRHVYLSISAGTYNNVTYYPQIVEGNKALPYVPYEDENIFDVNNPTIIDAFVNGSSGLLVSPTNNQKSFVVNVKPNTTYQVSGVERSSSNYGFFDDETLEINVSIATIKANIQGGSATLTSGQNSKWLVFLWKGGAETYGYSNIVIKEV